MSIALVPITPQRFPSWLERSQTEYKTDLVATGETPRAAEEHARDAYKRAFPAGTPTPGNTVFDLVNDTDHIVGYLWIGRDNSDDDTSWWVWDVVVEPEHRGKGYGRTAMQLAEGHARAKGAQTLGLSVFGFNAVARGMYESAGYETTSVKMRKKL
ncbi:GNAT family N-acetyltransferase [Rhodococcus sp. IEGM 1330]|uniref:GNAT family N-acetyltransferase n=1 Tax=Rhodococcus sp. IEGM 1330 TaxID=3082225 RepID=UPI0029559753|nr:GNAT family N-acetyltransferase [Rhodococcus sp. IEGM 1330]MDV8021168.1 GNAT family N-acetyltransferase [Rhodococcus sp. IEGM 1330]